MSMTISGGFTMTGGGFTLVAAPPSGPTAGWFGGGYRGASTSAVSSISRVTYATDTDTATSRGPLSVARSTLSATSDNTTYGWFGGGNGYSRVDRITYATDTDTASVRGSLTAITFNSSATGNSTDGYFAGGYMPTLGGNVSRVQRITYATDTATASVRGPLSLVTSYQGASTDNTTFGWFAGGSPGITTVNRITYATDTGTASVRGSLDTAAYVLAAVSTNTAGWFGGGVGLSTVQRITYATDTATASLRGPLSLARFFLAASTDNNTYGWFTAGNPGPVSVIDRITYATDTSTASVRGPLNATSYRLAGVSGVQ